MSTTTYSGEENLVIRGPLAVGSDHAGFPMKMRVIEWLKELGIEVNDFGTYDEVRTDYPDFGAKVAKAISNGHYQHGILICASGIGMSIVANKFKGVRAALCTTEYAAEYCRRHNNANIFVIGGRTTPEVFARRFLHIWLKTAYEGGRHDGRVNKINALPDCTDE
ncbi:ribose 5-phosphate isomerase B [candidate division KSB1 bacterium]|nr:ribose 5-phosphate isomerase B [candidate division KSB1 bacterium]